MRKIILSVGLFDKETKKLEIDIQATKMMLARITSESFGGATVYESVWAFTHESGETVYEPSIRIESLCFAKNYIELGKLLAERIKKELNQESVLMEFMSTKEAFI